MQNLKKKCQYCFWQITIITFYTCAVIMRGLEWSPSDTVASMPAEQTFGNPMRKLLANTRVRKREPETML